EYHTTDVGVAGLNPARITKSESNLLNTDKLLFFMLCLYVLPKGGIINMKLKWENTSTSKD
ncbi:MAG: hypothetical protein ACI4UO_06680, partial [Paludibacteraceae bacterium]